MTEAERFDGEICGFGTTSGTRLVVGCWTSSPFGRFADVMVERADGHRVLLAPDDRVADYVSSIYTFDEVRTTAVEVAREPSLLRVSAGPLSADIELGRRTRVGQLLAVLPRRLATSATWATLLDPVVRRVRPGVRTRGATPGGVELYGATDERAVTHVRATWDGVDLGGVADVRPPVRFGFGSSPRTPSLVAVVTTVRRVRPADGG